MKKLGLGVLGFVAILVAALLVAPGFVDWNAHKDRISQEVFDLAGRELVIDGDVSLVLLPTPTSLTSDSRFVYAVQSGTPQASTGVLSFLLYTPGDFDGDEDVDLADWAHLQRCHQGNGVAPDDPECLVFDIDEDDDVDLDDFDLFQDYFTGPQ